MKSKIKKLRHILFRIKAKLFLNSRLGEIYRFLSWKPFTVAHGKKVLYKKTHEAFRTFSMKQIADKAIVECMSWENEMWTYQDDVIYEFKNAIFIEPVMTLAFSAPNLFITETKSKAHAHIIPSVRYLFSRPDNQNMTYISSVIHFDGYAGKTFYHFIDDAVAPLLLLLKSGKVPDDVPILVNEFIYNKPWFCYFRNLPLLAKKKWIVQKKDEWIRTDRLYKALSSQTLWRDVYEEAGKVIVKKPYRRIFLSRKELSQRNLKNIAELQPILEDYGFETVFAEDMTYKEQVRLFTEVRHIIAIHGAGMTNLLHSELSEVYLLELFSSSLVHPHYYWVLNQIGIHYYDALMGSKLDINWSFTIDKANFSAAVKRMIETK